MKRLNKKILRFKFIPVLTAILICVGYVFNAHAICWTFDEYGNWLAPYPSAVGQSTGCGCWYATDCASGCCSGESAGPLPRQCLSAAVCGTCNPNCPARATPCGKLDGCGGICPDNVSHCGGQTGQICRNGQCVTDQGGDTELHTCTSADNGKRCTMPGSRSTGSCCGTECRQEWTGGICCDDGWNPGATSCPGGEQSSGCPYYPCSGTDVCINRVCVPLESLGSDDCDEGQEFCGGTCVSAPFKSGDPFTDTGGEGKYRCACGTVYSGGSGGGSGGSQWDNSCSPECTDGKICHNGQCAIFNQYPCDALAPEGTPYPDLMCVRTNDNGYGLNCHKCKNNQCIPCERGELCIYGRCRPQ